MIDSWAKQYHRFLKRISRSNESALEAKNIQSAIELGKLVGRYIPWPSSSMTASGLKLVVDDILLNKREIVLELGSGISTVYLAAAARILGTGHVVSIEQNDDWAANVRGWLNETSLGSHATVAVAPLQAVTLAGVSRDWYSVSALDKALSGRKVSLMLVDGPTACSEGRALARYPALPVLGSYLNANCAVFLDDTDREGEANILQFWERECGFSFRRITTSGPIAYASRGAAFYIGN